MRSFTTAVLIASSLAGSTHSASVHARHQEFHAKRHAPEYAPSAVEPAANSSSPCGCYTYTTTWYGEAGLVPEPKTSSSNSTTSATAVPSSDKPMAPVSHAEPTTSMSEPAYSTPAPETTSSETSLSQNMPNDKPTSSSPAPYTASAATSEQSSVLPYSSKATSKSPSSAWVAPTYYSLSSTHAASSSSAVASSASPSSTKGSSGSISPNGDKWAFCYTPYDKGGSCKSASDVASDVAAIKAKGFTTVRLYATDCSGPENVGVAARASGMKVILGIYVDESGIGSNTDEQISTLTSWGKNNWDMVEMVIAGNEAVFYGYASASQIANFVLDVKSKFQAAGYSGPVGTTEPLGTFQENADILCTAVDYAGANIHPYFNTDVTAEMAGDFVLQQLGDLADACNNEKEAYNLESGWPSLGLANGLAIPGSFQQKIAIESILTSAGGKSAIFSFENDAWKAPGPFDVEQYWGCADLFDS